MRTGGATFRLPGQSTPTLGTRFEHARWRPDESGRGITSACPKGGFSMKLASRTACWVVLRLALRQPGRWRDHRVSSRAPSRRYSVAPSTRRASRRRRCPGRSGLLSRPSTHSRHIPDLDPLVAPCHPSPTPAAPSANRRPGAANVPCQFLAATPWPGKRSADGGSDGVFPRRLALTPDNRPSCHAGGPHLARGWSASARTSWCHAENTTASSRLNLALPNWITALGPRCDRMGLSALDRWRAPPGGYESRPGAVRCVGTSGDNTSNRARLGRLHSKAGDMRETFGAAASREFEPARHGGRFGGLHELYGAGVARPNGAELG